MNLSRNLFSLSAGILFLGFLPGMHGSVDFAVDISSHSNGQTIQGTQRVVAAVANEHAVRQVVFYVDGVPVAVDALAPFEFTWTPPLGAHLVEARAYSRFASATSIRSDSVSLTVSDSGNTPPSPPTNLRILQ